MTPQDIITTARYTLNDVDSTGYRQTDAELLDYVNGGMREISALRPDLFSFVGDYTCVVSSAEQQVTFADAQEVLKVLCIHGGAALTPFDMSTMDSFRPGWRTDTAGAATSWSKHPVDPLRFFIYPKAPATAQTLDLLYVRVPTTLAIGDTISEIPASLTPALSWYVVAAASAKDDEYANSGRATALHQRFLDAVRTGQ